MKSQKLISLFILITLSVLHGCSNLTDSEQRATVIEREQGPIIIGVAWPFETANDLFLEGVELAVSEINESGSVLNRPIELINKDDDATVTKGLEIAQEFAENEKVVAVIGHRNSYVSIPASSIYEKAGIVMLSPASSSPELTNENDQYIFRNIASDDQLAKEIAQYAHENGHTRLVINYDDNAYGEGLANAFENHARALGIDIVDRMSYYSSSSELEQFKYKWENLQYDGMFIAKSNPEGAQYITELRKANIQVPLFAGNAMDSPELWNLRKEELEGVAVGTFFNPVSDRAKVVDFIDAFTTEFDRPPSQYSTQGYDAVYLLAAAIEHGQSIVPKQIASSLHSIGEVEGVAGIHEFAPNGDDIGTLFIIKRIHNGEPQYLMGD